MVWCIKEKFHFLLDVPNSMMYSSGLLEMLDVSYSLWTIVFSLMFPTYLITTHDHTTYLHLVHWCRAIVLLFPINDHLLPQPVFSL